MLPSLHRSTLDYCFLLYLIFQCIQATQEEQLSTGIIHLDAYHFIGKADSSKNSTHQLDSSLFNHTLTSTFFIEMELTVEGSIFEAVQIVFGLNNKNALKLDSNSSLLVADYIDVGGFYLRKKYFHLSIPIEYLQNNNTYLTIYQNQLISQVISYELLIGSENEGDNHDKKRCPFDCLGNGVCDYSLGTCNCRKGYFDFDCSRLALSLDHFKSQNINDTFMFNWNSTLTPKTRNAFYYLPIESRMDNSLILKIHSIAEKQTADLLVVFSTQQHQNGSAIIPQATYSLSPSQLKNEVYLQLLLKNPSSRELQIIQDSVGHSRMISQISIKRSLELSQNIQGQLTNFSYYLIGFMQIDGNSIEDYSVTLQPKKNEIQSETDTFFNIHGSTLIICLFAVLVLLVCLLLCLLICLYRRNGIINQILKEINLKKNEKSEEMKTILALMPETIYNDNFKLALQHGDAEEPACSVCLCEFEKDDILRQTYCPHAFHSDCLQSWLLKQKNCPHCRNPLSSAAIKGRVKSPQRNKHKLPLFSFNQPKQDLQQQGYGKEVGFIRQIDETTNEVNNSPLFDNQKNFEKQVSIPVEKKETKSSRKFQVNQQELPNDFTNVLNQNQIEQNTPKNSKLFQDILPIELNNNNNMQAGTLITDVHSISLGEDSCKRNFRNRSSILSNGESLMKDSISQFSCKSSRNNHTRFKSYAPRKDSLTEE